MRERDMQHSSGKGSVLISEGRRLSVDYEIAIRPQFDGEALVAEEIHGRIWGEKLPGSFLADWCQSVKRLTLEIADGRRIEISAKDSSGAFLGWGGFF